MSIKNHDWCRTKEKQAANQAVKDSEKQRQVDALAAKSWTEGSNVRGASKAQAAAAKADEAARKKHEKVRRYYYRLLTL